MKWLRQKTLDDLKRYFAEAYRLTSGNEIAAERTSHLHRMQKRNWRLPVSKLYEIANEYAKLMDSDLEPEMIADTIEGMEGEFTDKIEQLLAIIKMNLVMLNASRKRQSH